MCTRIMLWEDMLLVGSPLLFRRTLLLRPRTCDSQHALLHIHLSRTSSTGPLNTQSSLGLPRNTRYRRRHYRSLSRLLERGHAKKTGNRDATAISENCSQPELTTYYSRHSVTCGQLRLITILGNCGCVAVASFLGVPSPLGQLWSSSFSAIIQRSLEISR
jgi:hypothetical protein